MTRRKSGEGDLEKRVARLEKLIKEYFGKSIEELETNPDDPIVEERRYGRSVFKVHKSGAVERLHICPYCGAEVHDLPMHKAKEHPYI